MRLTFFLLIVSFSIFTNAQEQTKFIAQHNAFAIKFYQQLNSEKNSNLCYSPFSLYQAMGMTYVGARGNTKNEMQQVFGFDNQADVVLKQFENQQKKITQNTKHINYLNANALWLQKDYPVQENYLHALQQSFNAQAVRVNFKRARKRKKAVQKINEWVARQTKDKIQELVPPKSVSRNTRLIISNALYFNGLWQTKFDEKNSKSGKFFSAAGKQNATYMQVKSKFNLYYDDLIQVLELPYQNNEQSMFIILPKKQQGLKQIEKTFDLFYLGNILADKQKKTVIAVIPKFSCSTTLEPIQTFIKMGMHTPFNTNADFSGISGNPDLFIDKIFHNTTLEISENGTEAAAASAVIMSRKSDAITPVFKADHPFMYIICDNKTGLLLYMGAVYTME